MNFLKHFIIIVDSNNSLQEMAAKYEVLTEKYFDALKFYCPDCKRGFDKKIGKNMHDRWNHNGNPPIVSKQTEPVDNLPV